MEVTGACEALDLDDPADVGAVRRRFALLAHTAGLDEARTGDAALIASELASNVLKHGQRGGALIGPIGEGDRRGVRIAAWDRGRGMNVAACLRDGMSTAGTRGAGLGAVQRLASRFDAHAPAGKGTVVVADVFPHAPPPPRARFAIAGACVPYPGEQVCGDGWAAIVDGDVASVIAIDGLGHGRGAADAAAAVLASFRARPLDPPAAILERAHGAARATRGAAATVVRLELAARTVTVAGVGNVTPWLIAPAPGGPSQPRQIVTQHGTLGQATPRVREERVGFPPGALLVLCTDGIKSRWNLDDQPGLAARAPATVAAALWRDAARGRDDATVVVVAEAS